MRERLIQHLKYSVEHNDNTLWAYFIHNRLMDHMNMWDRPLYYRMALT